MKKKLIVLSGAGVSAESGIATFRDSNGLWENHKIEDVATPEAWQRNPDLVNTFYNLRRANLLQAQPNAAHLGLATLEQEFEVHIITQNVDDLHERAGSTQVLHLHGELLKMRCEEDETDIQPIKKDITAQTLSKRGKRMRPQIVWFGEAVPNMDEAISLAEQADIFVVVGTSLQVYPAAGLLHFVPAFAPKFVIDTQLPYIANKNNIHFIEKPATTGVAELIEILKTKYL